ncbi:MAG TPA: DinB family protein [Vicinamibacterales bacterium]|jgi:tRNA-binding protein|nr:DinB family protein [Vicinamibacterales bacterium]
MVEPVHDYVARLLGLAGEDPLAILRSTPGDLARLLARVAPPRLARRSDPGKWSIAEILAHLADAELVAGYRVRTMLATDAAPIAAYDQNVWADTFHYATLDPFLSLELFSAYRTGTLRVSASIDPAQLEHYGVHQERGRETVRQLLRLLAGHDINHRTQIERALSAAGDSQSPWNPQPQKPEIPLDVIERVDLRVGTIVALTEVANADRLAQITVDFGSERRQVVAGIRQERTDLSSIVGRQALFYFNLPKKQIRGLTSEAMLCDAGYADGLIPVFLQPERPVPDGVRAE